MSWRCGRSFEALARARALCVEVGDLASAAKIARLEYQHRPDPLLLRDEGVALLDAERVDQAVRPLLEASRLCPGDPAIERALAVARNEWPNPRAEIERLVAEARGAGATPSAATSFLQAARIVRIQGGDPQIYGRLLKAAFDSAPREDHVFGLYESFLVQRGDGDELLALYRQRIEHAPDLSTRFDDLRRAGVRLVLRNVQPGLGLRLLDRGLREAYAHAMPEIPGQLACLELLRRHAVSSNLLPRLVALLSEALAIEQDDLTVVWLAAIGVEVAWQSLGQAEVARGYAGRLAALAPNHPALREYLAGGGHRGCADQRGGRRRAGVPRRQHVELGRADRDAGSARSTGSGASSGSGAGSSSSSSSGSGSSSSFSRGAGSGGGAGSVRAATGLGAAPFAATGLAADVGELTLIEPEPAATVEPAEPAAANWEFPRPPPPPSSSGIEIDLGGDSIADLELGERPSGMAVGVADLSIAYAPPAIEADGDLEGASSLELDVARPAVADVAVAGEAQFSEEAIDRPIETTDEAEEAIEPIADLELAIDPATLHVPAVAPAPAAAPPSRPSSTMPPVPASPRTLGRVALVARPATWPSRATPAR